MITKTKFPIRVVVGSFQVLIGFILSYLVLTKILSDGLLSSLILGIPISFLIILSFYAGISLLRNKRRGINLSFINLSFHLFQFSFNGIYYYMLIGPFSFLGYKKVAENGINFWSDYGFYNATVYFSITRENNDIHFVTINLVILLLLITLYYIKTNKNTVPNIGSPQITGNQEK